MSLPIDLRSDTVTRPTPAMREAMARAEVGDDQYGEDPTTNRLQAELAALLGKEAALWLPSGTMSNQVAVMALARPGDEVITAREAHAGWHEVGAAAANAGVQIVEVGTGGVFNAAQFEAAIKPAGLPVFPQTTVVEIENTHNRAGGVVVPQPLVQQPAAPAVDATKLQDELQTLIAGEIRKVADNQQSLSDQFASLNAKIDVIEEKTAGFAAADQVAAIADQIAASGWWRAACRIRRSPRASSSPRAPSRST